MIFVTSFKFPQKMFIFRIPNNLGLIFHISNPDKPLKLCNQNQKCIEGVTFPLDNGLIMVKVIKEQLLINMNLKSELANNLGCKVIDSAVSSVHTS